jgi:hypothetical protein
MGFWSGITSDWPASSANISFRRRSGSGVPGAAPRLRRGLVDRDFVANLPAFEAVCCARLDRGPAAVAPGPLRPRVIGRAIALLAFCKHVLIRSVRPMLEASAGNRYHFLGASCCAIFLRAGERQRQRSPSPSNLCAPDPGTRQQRCCGPNSGRHGCLTGKSPSHHAHPAALSQSSRPVTRSSGRRGGH